jgi:hypothetical protein
MNYFTRDNSIEEFYEDLYNKIIKDEYSNSYIDYKNTNLTFKTELYKAIKKYKKDNNNDNLLKKFMKDHPNIIIKKIDNIYIGAQYVGNKDGSRGSHKNGYYNLIFSIYYTKK